jgi:predicted GIY-YIG superfamily endonuclease
MITYIIKCSNGEVYCGKTNDLDKRMKQHQNERYPHWFCNSKRRNFILAWSYPKDIEYKIKDFGVKDFLNIVLPSTIGG